MAIEAADTRASLPVLQGLILLSTTSFVKGDIAVTSQYATMAANMALYLRVDDVEPWRDAETGRISWQEFETRQRCWLAACFMDRETAAMIGVAPNIPDGRAQLSYSMRNRLFSPKFSDRTPNDLCTTVDNSYSMHLETLVHFVVLREIGILSRRYLVVNDDCECRDRRDRRSVSPTRQSLSAEEVKCECRKLRETIEASLRDWLERLPTSLWIVEEEDLLDETLGVPHSASEIADTSPRAIVEQATDRLRPSPPARQLHHRVFLYIFYAAAKCRLAWTDLDPHIRAALEQKEARPYAAAHIGASIRPALAVGRLAQGLRARGGPRRAALMAYISPVTFFTLLDVAMILAVATLVLESQQTHVTAADGSLSSSPLGIPNAASGAQAGRLASDARAALCSVMWLMGPEGFGASYPWRGVFMSVLDSVVQPAVNCGGGADGGGDAEDVEDSNGVLDSIGDPADAASQKFADGFRDQIGGVLRMVAKLRVTLARDVRVAARVKPLSDEPRP
ncbi:hypothetical protein HK405_002802, partial [Cladochytrium tenue]